ncbi:membrane protein insertase YidC [Candidatus Gromoviella agglomerans]|uniref:membrane protein insertase YidC n=1 Tax=Candidatus Gromoviella agglomerans TaxID=2806609 RepID=UPI001E57A4A7|nr:membrane protein insertase YidC [Candidatus Gromoviella agglomerans]
MFNNFLDFSHKTPEVLTVQQDNNSNKRSIINEITSLNLKPLSMGFGVGDKIYISSVRLNSFTDSRESKIFVLNSRAKNNNMYVELNFSLNSIEDPSMWHIIEICDKSVKFEKILKDCKVICHITELSDYMFEIKFTILNRSNRTHFFKPIARICRDFTNVVPEESTSSIVSAHEGFVGMFDGELIEKKYSDLVPKSNKNHEFLVKNKKGWGGITDKYWLTVIAMSDDLSINSTSDSIKFESQGVEVFSNQDHSIISLFFCGPKDINLLDKYKNEYFLDKFDLAIDFGILYFITRPLLYFLKWIYWVVGNFGLAIIVLTLFLKVLFVPFAKKSHLAMAKMRNLKPKMDYIKQMYANDKQKMNLSLADLYRKEKINPISGFLVMIMQLPVFFALYKVLFVCIELRQAPFIWWIKDLSMPDPTSLFNLFGLIKWNPPPFLQIGLWPIFMGMTMLLQQKFASASIVDDNQRKFMMILPVVFSFMMAQFPAGLIIYWSFSNILSILQQMWFNKKYK